MIGHRAKNPENSGSSRSMGRISLALGTLLPVSLLVGLLTVMTDFYSESGSRSRCPSEAMSALDEWAAQRAYPEATIPGNRYYTEHEKTLRVLRKAGTMLRTDDTWSTIGPRNQGGRTIALAVDPLDPDVIYAGSASGGLWRCTMSGASYSWELIDTGFPVLGVNAISIDPRDSDVLYIGTGEVYGYQSSIGGLVVRTTRGSYGIGLLKSTDRGLSWIKSIDWSQSQQRGILSIEINPLNPDIVFAGTTEGTYRSTDCGESWTKVHSELMAVDLVINPVDTNIVYVSCGNLGTPGTGLYRSSEGGRAGTWTQLGGLPASWTGKALLDIYHRSPNFVYADIANDFTSEGLYRSSDHGDHWTRLTDLDYAQYQGWFSHYVRVHPADSMQILCAGVYFYRSTNGGDSFYRRPGMHVDHHAFANHPVDPYTVYFANDGGVYRTTNGGDSFEYLYRDYITTQFYPGFSSSPSNPNLAIGGLQDNNTVMYKGSQDWTLGLIGGDGSYTAIDPQDDSRLYGSSQRLTMYTSTNRGLSWQNISNSFFGSHAAFVAPFILAPSHPWILYAGDEFVYRTKDRGKRWTMMNGQQALNGNSILCMSVAYDDPDFLYAATAPSTGKRGEVFRSTDGGDHWAQVTNNLPDRYTIDIAVSPQDGNTAFITLSGFGTSHLYRTDDGGMNWTDTGSGLPDVPTSAVAVDPVYPDIVYVGNDLGVYVSTNGGVSWLTFTEGFPSAVLVMDLSISPQNRKLRAVTHGNGVYERDLIDPASGNDPPTQSPREPVLVQNYPNPFNSITAIPFILAESEFVTLRVYNVLGRPVRTLVSRPYPTGRFTVLWDGSTDQGRPAESGEYIIRLETGSVTRSITSLFVR